MKELNARKRTIRNILIFCFMVVTMSIIGPLLGGNPEKPGLGFIIWGTAPMVAALLIRIVTRDWSDAGFKPAFKKNVQGYILSILLCPVMMLLTLLFGVIVSATSVTDFSAAEYISKVIPGMAVFFIFAVFEEFGWRGYLEPKLASIGMNRFLAYAITALVWATWHMPYIRELAWISTNSGELITFIPRFYLLLFTLSIIYGEIRKATGSVWPAVLLHCITNSVQHPLDAEYLSIRPGMEFIVSFNGLFMTAVALGIGLFITIHGGIVKKLD